MEMQKLFLSSEQFWQIHATFTQMVLPCGSILSRLSRNLVKFIVAEYIWPGTKGMSKCLQS